MLPVLLKNEFHTLNVTNLYLIEDILFESNLADIGGAYGVEGI